ncbi:MAG TPA: DNA polymerase Y family protein [Bacillota bacterium]|jgi:DNA polymerase-4
MRRIAFIEVRGLLCGALAEGLIEARGQDGDDRPAAGAKVVIKDGRVLDFSAEAGAAGVLVGVRERHAKQACHWAKLVDYDEAAYRPVVSSFFDLLINLSPVIEPVSETQAFVDLTGLRAEGEALAALVGSAVPRMAFKLWIGIASSKLVAKAAVLGSQGAYTPARLTQVTTMPGAEIIEVLRGGEADYLAPLPPDRLWRLDEATVSKLEGLGITTIGQLAHLPQGQLNRRFGLGGRLILDLARGLDPAPVRPLYPRREFEERLPFDAGVSDAKVVAAAAGRLAVKLSRRLSQNFEGCRRVLLEVRAGPTAYHAARGFPRPESSAATLKGALMTLLSRLTINEPVTSLKAVAGDLTPLSGLQPDLFYEPVAVSHERAKAREGLGGTIEALRQKYSDRVIAFGKDDEVPRRERMLALWDPYRSGRSEPCPVSSTAASRSNSTPTIPHGPSVTALSTG